MAILPGHLMRSIAGGFDNESIAVSAMVFQFGLDRAPNLEEITSGRVELVRQRVHRCLSDGFPANLDSNAETETLGSRVGDTGLMRGAVRAAYILLLSYIHPRHIHPLSPVALHPSTFTRPTPIANERPRVGAQITT